MHVYMGCNIYTRSRLNQVLEFQTRRLQEKRKVTALHIAAFKKGENEDIVKMLLDAKCDKDAQDHDGFTALHHAAR